MVACVGRLLRPLLAVAFVSGLGFAATNANAQFIGEQVCADVDDIADNFSDPLNWEAFGDVSNCNKICKSYVNKCKAFSKNWRACAKRATSDEAELDRKAECDPLTDSTEKKDCQDSVSDLEKFTKDEVKSTKDALLTFCEGVEPDCVSVCKDGLPE